MWVVESSLCAAKLEEGSSGLSDSLWCPDSKQVLTWSEFGVRVNVWSLSHKRVSHIQYPKLLSAGCVFYGDYVVICERRDREDYISVFNYKDWKLHYNFKVSTEDLEKVYIVNGAVLLCDTHFNPSYCVYTLQGECVTKVELYKDMLGIKSVAASSNEQFVVLGCYDGTCKLVNSVTWSVLKEYKHATIPTDAVCYVEVEGEGGARFTIPDTPPALPLVKPHHDDQYLLVGVGLVKFSTSSRYLATRCDGAPNVVWIWDMEVLQLASTLVFRSPVICIEWSGDMLAMSCNSDKVYLWCCSGALAVSVPNCVTLNGAGELGPIRSIKWSCKGNCLVLKGDYHFCLCYFPNYQI